MLFPLLSLVMFYLPFGAGGLLPRPSPDLRPGTVLGPLGGRGLLMVIPLKTPWYAACLLWGSWGMQIEP